MALGKYGPQSFNFRPIDADVYDQRGQTKMPTFVDSASTPGPPKIDAAGRVEFWVEAGTYHLMLTTADGDTVTEAVTVAAGGVDDPNPNAASSPLLTAKSADYAAVNGDAVLMDATAANRVVTLPAPAANALVWVKKSDATAHTVTIAPHVTEQIDGGSSIVLTEPNDARTLSSDGTDWWIF